MEVSNSLYKGQGIHVISAIFTVERGITKILLVQRKNKPHYGMWSLVGGALYNNENLLDGAKREIFEKTGITDINIDMFNVFGKVDRSPVMRMVAVAYIGVIDAEKVKILKETVNTQNMGWFTLDNIPTLAYDHNEIIEEALKVLQQKIVNTDILKSLFPNGFTIPEIQKAYEAILGKELDRRNFRKKLLSLGLIIDTKKVVKFDGNKPAKLYKFKKKIESRNVF